MIVENKMKPYNRNPKTYAIIFGAFNLGLYIAIQGPTLIDLIDLLHINNDTMSYSMAFASLAYSVGGLLSGFLFNYVNRQVLIACFYIVFGVSNIITPFITSYMIFSILNVFKMMCAGGTDCGANVWILELWPGQDEWLQAIHFFFAAGCALGPLIVEPFLSEEQHATSNMTTSGHMTITNEPGTGNEARIYIPFGVSGSLSILAAMIILYLTYLDERMKKCQKQSRKSKIIEHEAIQMLQVSQRQPQSQQQQQQQQQSQPVGSGELSGQTFQPIAHLPPPPPPTTTPSASARQTPVPSPTPTPEPGKGEATREQQQQSPRRPSHSDLEAGESALPLQLIPQVLQIQPQSSALLNQQQQSQNGQTKASAGQLQVSFREPPKDARGKITSKSEDDRAGLPPYYVMFAVLLAAMSLSFYCGIEITSMNYLATFAMNIDLGLHKSTAVMMSSALTISFMVGRGIGIWLAARMKPHKLFYLCASVMIFGNIVMLIFANTAEHWLWVSICLFGMGCGPMLPAVISFFDYKISKVTNAISGVFISGSMVIVALNSLIIGHHVVDNALILIVCNLTGSVFLLLLFGTLHILANVKRHQRIRKYQLKQMLFDQQQQQQQQEEDEDGRGVEGLQLEEQQPMAGAGAAPPAEASDGQLAAVALPNNDDQKAAQQVAGSPPHSVTS